MHTYSDNLNALLVVSGPISGPYFLTDINVMTFEPFCVAVSDRAR